MNLWYTIRPIAMPMNHETDTSSTAVSSAIGRANEGRADLPGED